MLFLLGKEDVQTRNDKRTERKIILLNKKQPELNSEDIEAVTPIQKIFSRAKK